MVEYGKLPKNAVKMIWSPLRNAFNLEKRKISKSSEMHFAPTSHFGG